MNVGQESNKSQVSSQQKNDTEKSQRTYKYFFARCKHYPPEVYDM